MGVVAVGVLVHLVLSLVYALLLAFIIHRWGLVVGIVGGALFGVAIYIINYYTFTALFSLVFSPAQLVGAGDPRLLWRHSQQHV